MSVILLHVSKVSALAIGELAPFVLIDFFADRSSWETFENDQP